MIWSQKIGVPTSPALDATEKYVYVCDNSKKCYICETFNNGFIRHTISLSDPVLSSPVVSADGLFYFGSKSIVYGYAMATQKFFFDVDGNLAESSPVLDVDGTIYIGVDKSVVSIVPTLVPTSVPIISSYPTISMKSDTLNIIIIVIAVAIGLTIVMIILYFRQRFLDGKFETQRVKLHNWIENDGGGEVIVIERPDYTEKSHVTMEINRTIDTTGETPFLFENPSRPNSVRNSQNVGINRNNMPKSIRISSPTSKLNSILLENKVFSSRDNVVNRTSSRTSDKSNGMEERKSSDISL
jgi:hypothetical protein